MLRRSLLASTVICALPFALAACSEKPHADPRTEMPMVRVAIVQGASAAARSFTGTVAARVQSDLGFRVSGKVLERLVDTGQTVKRGQPLMRIDAADLKLAAHAQREAVAESALTRYRTSLEELDRDLAAEEREMLRRAYAEAGETLVRRGVIDTVDQVCSHVPGMLMLEAMGAATIRNRSVVLVPQLAPPQR